ncbi:Farnesyl-diphosphate farnesyltransferase [Rhizoclosmatium sp. JEL0117]|nr:Farnesyl-diphosphate farnesyltransferase [Rhizoclosmatium sp. JEL0117]
MCYYFLNKTSRSFARVIQELDPKLSLSVCVFALALRGLDTIEDDMTLSNETKLPLLKSFHQILYTEGWNFDGNGPQEKDRFLMVEFNEVIDQFLRLGHEEQTVIADVIKRMGAGMAEFCDGKRVVTMADYNLYTHTVAGLIGIGLTGLFNVSGLESITLDESFPNSMGQFLQKVNIIKDFAEDLSEGRQFWPQRVWEQYTAEGEGLEVFVDPNNLENALGCLNELCIDALQLVPDCLEYMSKLKNPSVIRCCAIPQVVALASLSCVFNNRVIFGRKKFKLRYGLAAKIMFRIQSFDDVKESYRELVGDLQRQNRKRGSVHLDSSLKPMTIICSRIKRWLYEHDREVGKQVNSSECGILAWMFITILTLGLAVLISIWLNASKSEY